MNSKAFSLIELLVVVAIIAILASIAVPTYQQYSVRAKIASITPLLDNIMQQTLAFVSTHGRFPAVTDLGYTVAAGTSGIGVNNATQLNPYLASTGFGIVIDPGSDTCGQTTTFGVNFNPALFSGLPSAVTVLGYSYAIYHINGAYVTICSYFEGDNASTWYSSSLFPSACINQYQGGNATAWNAYANGFQSRSSCST